MLIQIRLSENVFEIKHRLAAIQLLLLHDMAVVSKVSLKQYTSQSSANTTS